MVHQHLRLVQIVFNHIEYLKNVFYHLVTISVPKVAKNGQIMPILANSEITLLTLTNGNNHTPRVFSTKTQDFTPIVLKSLVDVHLLSANIKKMYINYRLQNYRVEMLGFSSKNPRCSIIFMRNCITTRGLQRFQRLLGVCQEWEWVIYNVSKNKKNRNF